MLIVLSGLAPHTSSCLPRRAGGRATRGRQREGCEGALSLLSNEASYQTDETVRDETSVAVPSPLSSPFIPGVINQLSETDIN